MENLIPATSQNKRVLIDAVDRLQESNLTSYETALDFAFNAFERVSERSLRLFGLITKFYLHLLYILYVVL